MSEVGTTVRTTRIPHTSERTRRRAWELWDWPARVRPQTTRRTLLRLRTVTDGVDYLRGPRTRKGRRW